MGNPRLTLIVTGSIAAVKSFGLIELLQAAGMEVSVLLTDAAQQWVTPDAARMVSNQAVITASDIRQRPRILPDMLACSDAIAVAPASADFIRQLACGDTPLAQAITGSRKPLVLAPAMNVMMWQHPATQRNCQRLLEAGVRFLGPVQGGMACGDEGMGRFMDPADIAPAISALLAGSHHPAFETVKSAMPAHPHLPALDKGLSDKSPCNILLLIQGGDDALASYALVSALRARRYRISCAMAEEVGRLIPPEGLATVTGSPVYTRHYQDDLQGMEHIRLPERTDIVLVAPATAEGIREMAEGGAHSFPGCIYLASKKPVVLVPSADPGRRPEASHLEQLRRDGVYVLDVGRTHSPVGRQHAEAVVMALEELLQGETGKQGKAHGG